MTDSPDTTSERAPRIFNVIAVMSVAFLLISNIAATKVTVLDAGSIHLALDGGAILFPLTYALGDVLFEVYGFARTERTIILGFIMSVLVSLTSPLVQIAPIGLGHENQAAFEAILDFVPCIAAASVAGCLAGQLVNFSVLVEVHQRQGAECPWARLAGSTLFGEALDAVLLCIIAFVGIAPGCGFFNYVLAGYVYRIGVEVVLLPITHHVVTLVRKYESLKPEEVLAA